MAKKYNNDSITALKGADRVRKRPAVIFGSDGILGCQHSIFEILSNSIDEAREGYGSEIKVIRHKDYSVTIVDKGRGIPVGYNRKEKRFNWELLFCELYAGGKYNTNDAENYEYSLGLNGLGLCATQYSSEYMDVEILDGASRYNLRFEKGENVGGLKKVSDKSNYTGSRITWRPDLDVFTEINVDSEYFEKMLKEQAVVNKGLKFIYEDEFSETTKEFYYENGILDYIHELGKGKEFTDIFRFYDEGKGRDRDDKPEYKVKAEIVFAFNNDVNELKYFHNSSYLEHGGAPDKAVKTAFLYELDKFIKQYNLYNKNEKRIGFADVEDSLVLISNSFSTMTSYENQTKKSITNKFIQQFITELIRTKLEILFIENKLEGEKILKQILINKRSREKAESTRLSIKQKLGGKIDVTNKVKKFIDCREKDPMKRELFIVEGDSALGACKLARDSNFQALIPVRGKPLNTLKADHSKIFKNDIIMDIIKVIGCGVEVKSKHNKDASNFDIDSLQYDKIIITTDADVDGFQIRTLILTMFYTLVPSLIKEGKLYIAESPLYEIVSGSRSHFAYNEFEKAELLNSLNGSKFTIHRSKGLGENEPDMMWLTTMSPDSRRLIKVLYEDVEKMNKVFDALLGDDIDSRKEYISEKGTMYSELLDLS